MILFKLSKFISFNFYSRKEVVPTAYFVLSQMAKFPRDVLASASIWSFDSSVKKMSPGKSVSIMLFFKWYVEYVYQDPKTQLVKKDKHMELFSKFILATCSERLNGLDDLEEIIGIIEKKLTEIPCVTEDLHHYWRVMAEAYSAYVDKYDNVNQSNSKLMIKLGCSEALVKFPIEVCLNGPLKMWKMWADIIEKFNEKAALLVHYKTLKMEDKIAKIILDRFDEPSFIDSVKFHNLTTIVCKSLTESLPLETLSQESPNMKQRTIDGDPKSRVTNIVQVLVKLIVKLPQYKDKKVAAHSLAAQVTHILSQASNSSVLAALLKLLSPGLAKLLSLYSAIDTKFEMLVKKIHEMAVNKIQAHYEGSFTLELLEDLKPFLVESLAHKKRDIKTKTHQMWLLTFGVSLEQDKIPNEIKDLIKSQAGTTSMSHSSESLGPSTSNFAIPLSFGNYFAKKDEIKPKSSIQASPKPKANKKINIDEESSQDFVVIQSPSNKKRVLTDHQKDIMRQRRDDIPALYSEISRDDSVSVANIPTMFDSQNSVTSENTPDVTEKTPEENIMDTNEPVEAISEHKSGNSR